MKRVARTCLFVVTLAAGSVAHVAGAQPAPASLVVDRPAPQGVAVLAIGSNAHDEAFALARAIYGSRLRPLALDEVRARVLAGGGPPPNASRELRELSEIRAGLTGEDAAGRRLLTGIAQQIGVEALLVVKVEEAPAGPPVVAPSTMGAPEAVERADAGPESAAPGNAAAPSMVVARLFLAGAGDYDAARYSPDPGPPSPASWKSTVTSLEGRFPAGPRTAGPAAATAPAPPVRQEGGKSSPFYASGWFWGAIGGAALLATAFYFASRDTSSDTIHLQMRVPK